MEVKAEKRAAETFEIQKTKYESEIKNLKDKLSSQDEKLEQRKAKFTAIKSENGALKSELESAKHQLAILKSTSELELKKLQDRFDAEASHQAKLYTSTNEALKSDLKTRDA
jgi:chromosome segregation ATPase